MNAAGVERRRAWGLPVPAWLLLCAAGVAAAPQSAVERCREEPTDERRIACLEAALAGSVAMPAPGAEPGPPAQERPTPALRPDAPAPEPAAPARGPSRPALEPPAPAPESTPSAPESSAPAHDSAGGARSPGGIGAEQVRARRGGAELEAARGLRVASYDTVPFRRLQVKLENGQVWRQIEGDTQRLRVSLERNRTVDIEESALGGYKLRLNEIGRTIRVERIR